MQPREQSRETGSDHEEVVNLPENRHSSTHLLQGVPAGRSQSNDQADQIDDQVADQIADQRMQALRTFWHSPRLLFLLSAMLLFCFVQVFAVLQLEHGISSKVGLSIPSDFGGMQFDSCDRKSKIKFSSPDDCVISQAGHVSNAKYTILSAGQIDLTAMIRGYLARRELWYRRDAAGLVDKDGLVFYGPNSPELDIVRKMWWYADFAQKHYKESRLYPSDAERCKQSDPHFQYINPF